MANLPDIFAVKFFARLDLEQICRFLDGHELAGAETKFAAGMDHL